MENAKEKNLGNNRRGTKKTAVVNSLMVMVLLMICFGNHFSGVSAADQFGEKTATTKNQEDAEKQYEKGRAYYFGDGVDEDKEEAVVWFRKAAEQGYAEAQLNLGVMYDNGEGVAQDKKEAVKWYRKAAEQGNSTAKEILDQLHK